MAIGFIGTGNMGSPMALNLINAGYSVVSFDRSNKALESIKAVNGVIASSLQELAMTAETVITMLPTGDDVRKVYENEGGVIESVADNTLLIDCSTIDVENAQIVAKKASVRGLQMVDAPVSGGVTGAEAGTLTFMVGGSSEALERSRPLLATMGQNIVHAGKSGSGRNNFK